MKNKRQRDYMKYWRVIRYFVKRKYKLNTGELDMLFFLYSEEYFNVDKFNEFNVLLGWNKMRFDKLHRDGWIETYKKAVPHRRKALYGLSYKCVRMLDSVYDKLEGGRIPEHYTRNPIFLVKGGYNDKVYRNTIKKMNEAIRQEQCHSLEL
jgi:hypothetical protein